MRSLLLLLPEQTREPSRRRAMGNTFHKSVKHLGAKKNLSHVLNDLHPGTKKGNAYAIAYVLLTRAQVLLTRISFLTRSLRWLTRTTVLLTPHPYKGPLA
jgi:hypothetical protein